MKVIIVATALALLTGGCASVFTAKTKASWTMPDGRAISYESDKEQVGLKATFNEKTGNFSVEVDKSSTSEAAIQAALAQSQAMAKLFEAILPLLMKAAATGATGGAAAVVP